MSPAYVLVCPECGATVPSKNSQACPACKSPKPVPDGWHADEWLGKTVQSYNFQRRLGSGGYGKVYEVTRGRAARETRALKLISKDLFAGTEGKRVRERFEREAEVLGRLDHPHIVRCYDHGPFEEANWLYMELDLAPGRSLFQRVWPPHADEPACLSVQEALLMGQQLADALAYAHGEGVLHRDLSHNNVMLDGHGDGLKIKLIDFGLAKLLGDAKPGTRGEGTHDYMAPEQFLLGAVSDDHDARLDLYQLGGLLHFALTGQPPYSEQPGPSGTTSPVAVQQKLRLGRPGPAPSELRPELAREAPALDALIARLLSTSPQDRPNSAAEVLGQLGKLQQALHPSRPQRLAPQVAIDLGAAPPPAPRVPTQPEPEPAPPPPPAPIPSARLTQPEPPRPSTPRVPTQRERLPRNPTQPEPQPSQMPSKPARPALQHTSREATPTTPSEPSTQDRGPWRVLGVLGVLGLVASLATLGLYRVLQDDDPSPPITQEDPPKPNDPKPSETPPSDPTPAPPTPKVDKTPPPGMVYIPPGSFLRGSADAYGPQDETPPKTIELSGFFLDAKEVTVGQYNKCVEAGACGAPDVAGKYCSGEWAEYNHWSAEGPKAGRASHPINCINWKQAKTYCEWAGHEGGPRRLPTEAEWERAARGKQGEIYPWGNTPPGKGTPLYGNFADETAKEKFSGRIFAEGYTDSYIGTAPVGSFEEGKTEEGAYDMAGNVWEWGQDCYDSSYYNSAPSKDPKNDCDHNSASRRVYRSGSWFNRPADLRAANRSSGAPEIAGVDLGVRCARSIE